MAASLGTAADLTTGCVGNVSEGLDFSFRCVREFGAKFLLLQTFEDSRPQFEQLLFRRGSPSRFLASDLLLWDGKDLGLAAKPTVRNTEVDANHSDSRYYFGTTEARE
jgi:hypothetical protein